VCYFVDSIEHFIVLDVIGKLVERQKHDNLRRRFKESEAKVAFLEIRPAQYSTASDTGFGLPRNVLITQGSLDTGKSL